jgi:acyl carrier protein
MNATEIHDELKLILSRLVALPGLEVQDGLIFSEDIEGWDSFKFVELLIAAQERFRVELSARRIERIASFGDLAAAVADACATPAISE